MANIAEGFDCESNAEFAPFLGIARRSVAEVQALLYAALDIGNFSKEVFSEYFDRALRTKALIGGFKRSVQKHA
jgi:four helix bundle protein